MGHEGSKAQRMADSSSSCLLESRLTDEQRQLAWLTAEHAALSCESAVVALGPATQDPGVATLLIDAANLRRIADDLYQEIAQRVSAGTVGRQLH
jgi:hypothetical protein